MINSLNYFLYCYFFIYFQTLFGQNKCPKCYTKNLAGRYFRRIPTKSHTYVKVLNSFFSLIDYEKDSYQMHNPLNNVLYQNLQKDIKTRLFNALRFANDEFSPEYKHLWRFGVLLVSSWYSTYGIDYSFINDCF